MTDPACCDVCETHNGCRCRAAQRPTDATRARYGSLEEWMADLPEREAARAGREPIADSAAAASTYPRVPQQAALAVSVPRRHWHLWVRHEHPEWHGHCHPAEHSCSERHWHFLWRHRHTETGR